MRPEQQVFWSREHDAEDFPADPRTALEAELDALCAETARILAEAEALMQDLERGRAADQVVVVRADGQVVVRA